MLLISSDLNINNNIDLPLREENIDFNLKKVPKRIIPRKIDKQYETKSYEEKFQKLYSANQEFKNKIDSNLEYRNKIHNSNRFYNEYLYITFLECQYLLHTDSKFRALYRNNAKFKELYNFCGYFIVENNDRDAIKSSEKFRNKYHDDEKYRNAINNSIEFLDFQYLLYKNEKFKELYNINECTNVIIEEKNEEKFSVAFRKKYHDHREYAYKINNNIEFLDLEYLLYTHKEFQELYNNEEFKNKYHSDIEYRNKINNKDDKKYSFLLLQYLLYTDSRFKELYCNDKELRSAADQINIHNYSNFKLFRPYSSFVEHYYNDKEFQEKIYNDKEFMIDKILLYSNDNFMLFYYHYNNTQFKCNYNNNKYFRDIYRSSKRFRDSYHKYYDQYGDLIYDNKDFIEAIIYITLNDKLYDLYNKSNERFPYLYNNRVTFRKSFIKLYENSLEFQKKYHDDEIFRDNFNDSPKFREQCNIFFLNNLTT